MILIITFPDNAHVAAVTEHLPDDAYVTLDLADIPVAARISAHAGTDRDELLLDLPSGRRISLDEVGAVWNRRQRGFTLDPALQDETSQLFAWSETNETVQGLWQAMSCFWMNHPVADDAATRKVGQHRAALRAGLRIPHTLVTSDPAQARSFIEQHAGTGVVRKATRNLSQAPRETLRIGPEHLDQLDQVRFAPVIFQEYIPLGLDLRTTVVDGELFTTAFRSQPEYETDYRLGIGSADVFAYDLPDDVAVQLGQVMKHYGLSYGAVDFRVTPEGEHVFLEVNPAGEFMFAHQRTGQPIPQAIAAALHRHDEHG